MSSPDGAAKDASASWSEAARLAFPRSVRLTARVQFREAYSKGRRIGARSITLFAVPGAVGTSRIGITVTRKFGGAVERNRIKRRLREVFRRNLATLVPPLDIVVNVRPEAGSATVAGLEREFLDCFEQLVRKLRP